MSCLNSRLKLKSIPEVKLLIATKSEKCCLWICCCLVQLTGAHMFNSPQAVSSHDQNNDGAFFPLPSTLLINNGENMQSDNYHLLFVETKTKNCTLNQHLTPNLGIFCNFGIFMFAPNTNCHHLKQCVGFYFDYFWENLWWWWKVNLIVVNHWYCIAGR